MDERPDLPLIGWTMRYKNHEKFGRLTGIVTDISEDLTKVHLQFPSIGRQGWVNLDRLYIVHEEMGD